MYRIAWKSIITGITGAGDYILSIKDAEDEIVFLNTLFPEAIHWVEGGIAPLNLTGHRCSYGDMSFVDEPTPVCSPITSFDYERPPPLNLRGHTCSYGDMSFSSYMSPDASPLVNTVSAIPRVKKTCSFGDVSIVVYPNLTPCSSPDA